MKSTFETVIILIAAIIGIGIAIEVMGWQSCPEGWVTDETLLARPYTAWMMWKLPLAGTEAWVLVLTAVMAFAMAPNQPGYSTSSGTLESFQLGMGVSAVLILAGCAAAGLSGMENFIDPEMAGDPIKRNLLFQIDDIGTWPPILVAALVLGILYAPMGKNRVTDPAYRPKGSKIIFGISKLGVSFMTANLLLIFLNFMGWGGCYLISSAINNA